MTPEQHHPARQDRTGRRGVAHHPGRRRRRDPVTALFAAALAGDRDAEDALRTAALINDRAADALGAFASVGAAAALRDLAGEPARTADLDQVLTFLRPHLSAARAEQRAANGHGEGATEPGPGTSR